MTVGFLALPLLGGTSIWRLCLLAVPVCFLAMVALGLIAIIGRLLGAFSPEIAAASWLGIPYLLMGMVWFAPTYLVFLLAALNLRGCRTMARRLGLLRA